MKPISILFLLIFLALPWTSGCATAPLGIEVETQYDAIVIGAGMGGLSAATHLAVGGMDVLLLEQHYQVGGCTSSFSRGEFSFDAALHEMTVGGGDGIVFQIMEKAGVRDKVEMIPIPRLGRSIFPGLDFVHPHGLESFEGALKARWPMEAQNIEEFMELLDVLNEEVSELRSLYLGNPAKALLTKMAIPLRQRTLTWNRNKTVNDILDDYFEDEQLKSVLSQFWSYYGPPPTEQWGLLFMVAQYGYIKNGGWQIKGSSAALSEAYAERFGELGGTLMTDTLVEEIIVRDNRVHGVKTSEGLTYSSRFVISNADPYQTFFRLIGEEKSPSKTIEQLKGATPSNSLAGVYLGLGVEADHWGIEDYEIFYNTSYDEKAMYDSMMKGQFDKGSVSITFYSNLKDDFYAPPGKSVVTLHTYSDYDYWSENPEEYEAQKSQMMDQLIGLAEKLMPNLRDHIEVAEGMTPRTIESYTLQHKGAPYGMNASVDQQDRMDAKTGIGGLYLAGSWTFPAHGVGMAQVSGYLTANMILDADDRL